MPQNYKQFSAHSRLRYRFNVFDMQTIRHGIFSLPTSNDNMNATIIIKRA